ncbi:hypothetical protein ACN47E_002643 [Coniothyrium glycines]
MSSSYTSSAGKPRVIVDSEIERVIKSILKLCGTHKATISIRRRVGDGPYEHEVKSITTTLRHPKQHVTDNGKDVFHIASLTKPLVAAAVMIAGLSVPAKQPSSSRFQKFRGIPFPKVYNDASTDRIESLPGNPDSYSLLFHEHGLHSKTHQLVAPLGQPIMGLKHAKNSLFGPKIKGKGVDRALDEWVGYSNVNYVAVALGIEALSGSNLESFMNVTLFEPLGMLTTTMGSPVDGSTSNRGWVVDSNGFQQEIARPTYRADGAETAAFGAHSTAHDLDLFFKFLIDTFHAKGRDTPIPGFDLGHLSTLLTERLKTPGGDPFRSLGLFVPFDSPLIGDLSINRAQFPEERFTTYTVAPTEIRMLDAMRSGTNAAEEPDTKVPKVFYMAGSAIACSCATSFYLDIDKSFAIVVLTDTSGPVDAADHILRLLLQRMVIWLLDGEVVPGLIQPNDVEAMVEQAMNRSTLAWRHIEHTQKQEVKNAPAILKAIEGLYKGEGFDQVLKISKRHGQLRIAVNGPLMVDRPAELDLVWIDHLTVNMHIPPHLSVDWLGKGDWSNTRFSVESKEGTVIALTREMPHGHERYLKISSTS